MSGTQLEEEEEEKNTTICDITQRKGTMEGKDEEERKYKFKGKFQHLTDMDGQISWKYKFPSGFNFVANTSGFFNELKGSLIIKYYKRI